MLVEIKDSDQKAVINKEIDEGRLAVEDIEGEDWDLAAERAKKWGISVPDASVSIVAQKREFAVLLTGDGRLRKKSLEEGIDVKGTLWVIDHLLEVNAIPPEKAVTALDAILSGGTFLPRDECEKRRNSWESE